MRRLLTCPLGFTEVLINVCGVGGSSLSCALYVRSVTLYNLGPAGTAIVPQGPDKPLFAALGNYTSVLWNFKYSR